VREEGRLEIALRPFVFWDGAQPPRGVSVGFEGAKVSMLKDGAGQDVPLARVEPLPIGGIYPAGNEDRILVRLNDVPKHLVEELIAVEDRQLPHPPRLRPARPGARRAQHLLGARAGRQHHHAAAGEELSS
jgi:penicillin-binding protein 1B